MPGTEWTSSKWPYMNGETSLSYICDRKVAVNCAFLMINHFSYTVSSDFSLQVGLVLL